MPVLRGTVTFSPLSAIPRDRTTNTFHAWAPTVGTLTAESFADALRDFYNTTLDGGNPFGRYISAAMQRVAGIQVWDLSDPMPRPPIYEGLFTIDTPAGSTRLPREVALVASFQAVREAGVPQSRRRNRVFLGPLQTNSVDNDIPDSSLIGNAVKAMRVLYARSEAAEDWTWCTFSPTTNDWQPVDNGWVDNAWDTQRRRGQRASSRETWSD